MTVYASLPQHATGHDTSRIHGGIDPMDFWRAEAANRPSLPALVCSFGLLIGEHRT